MIAPWSRSRLPRLTADDGAEKDIFLHRRRGIVALGVEELDRTAQIFR